MSLYSCYVNSGMRVSAPYLRISRELEGRRPLSSLNHPRFGPQTHIASSSCPSEGPSLLCQARGGPWVQAGRGAAPPGPPQPPSTPLMPASCFPVGMDSGSASVSRRREFHIVWKAALPAVGSPKGLESWQHTEKYGLGSSLAFPEPEAWAEGGPSASALCGPGSRGLRLLRVKPVPGFAFRWVSVRPASSQGGCPPPSSGAEGLSPRR